MSNLKLNNLPISINLTAKDLFMKNLFALLLIALAVSCGKKTETKTVYTSLEEANQLEQLDYSLSSLKRVGAEIVSTTPYHVSPYNAPGVACRETQYTNHQKAQILTGFKGRIEDSMENRFHIGTHSLKKEVLLHIIRGSIYLLENDPYSKSCSKSYFYVYPDSHWW